LAGGHDRLLHEENGPAGAQVSQPTTAWFLRAQPSRARRPLD
jgi:hypothetical protein